MKKYLVTSALPYANGSIHLGHLVEYIQTDIWVRFKKFQGHTCHYMCADDTHGTPIMLNAKKQNKSPEDFIAQFHEEHLNDFSGFFVDFDIFGTTHSDENKALSEDVYLKAKEAGAIDVRSIDQLYCPSCDMFLPDRFIKGTCPSCKAEDQYGDSCEACSATYDTTDLIDPGCATCQATPVLKESEHHFFKLGQFQETIQAWLADAQIHDSVKNKLQEWFDSGLRDWDISRDAPYFGFKIPGEESKYFYVWLDAPVGYISTTQRWAESVGLNYEDIWRGDDYEIHHFIGKDILYFHTLFWPAMLKVSGYQLPKRVNVHGFLTVNGEKMSKSRGTFILASKYLEKLNPEFLRYYYASKLSSAVEDIDLNLEDFVVKLNSDVLGKVVNIGSRLGSIAHKKLSGELTTIPEDAKEMLASISGLSDEIAEAYDSLSYNKAMRLIMGGADAANRYIDATAPWAVVKTDADKAAQICTAGLNAFKMLMGYLKPVLPQMAEGAEAYLNCKMENWADITQPIENQAFNRYEHLAGRLQLEDVSYLTESLTGEPR